MMDRINPANWTDSLRNAWLWYGPFLLAHPLQAARPSSEIGKDWGSPKGQLCVDCHRTE